MCTIEGWIVNLRFITYPIYGTISPNNVCPNVEIPWFTGTRSIETKRTKNAFDIPPTTMTQQQYHNEREQWITVVSRWIFFFFFLLLLTFSFENLRWCCEFISYVAINRCGMIRFIAKKKTNWNYFTSALSFMLAYFINSSTNDSNVLHDSLLCLTVRWFGLLSEQQTWWEWWNLTYDSMVFRFARMSCEFQWRERERGREIAKRYWHIAIVWSEREKSRKSRRGKSPVHTSWWSQSILNILSKVEIETHSLDQFIHVRICVALLLTQNIIIVKRRKQWAKYDEWMNWLSIEFMINWSFVLINAVCNSLMRYTRHTDACNSSITYSNRRQLNLFSRAILSISDSDEKVIVCKHTRFDVYSNCVWYVSIADKRVDLCIYTVHCSALLTTLFNSSSLTQSVSIAQYVSRTRAVQAQSSSLCSLKETKKSLNILFFVFNQGVSVGLYIFLDRLSEYVALSCLKT